MKYRIKIHRATGIILSDEITADERSSTFESVFDGCKFFMSVNGNLCIVGEEVVKNSIIEFIEVEQ